MLKIRLKRFGKTHSPVFRIVVMPNKTKRQSNTVEEIGFIDPIRKIRTIKADRAKYWLSVGAQPTFTVERLLIKENIIKKDKKEDNKQFKMNPGKKSAERKTAKEAKKEPKAE